MNLIFVKMSRDTSVGLDKILEQLGPFGRYNIVNYALLLFPIYLAGMYGSVFVFEASDINYRYVQYNNIFNKHIDNKFKISFKNS